MTARPTATRQPQPDAARLAAARRASARRRAAARRRPRLSRLLAWLLSAVLGGAGLAWAQPAPGTLPSGGRVVVGQGQVQQGANLLLIQQSSPRLGMDWQSFNIGSAATVEFRQPSSASVALNRVVGNSSTEIYGKLKANGQVFLTNPHGVLFAPGSKVDVGGLVASTLDLTQQDFEAGRYQFRDVGGPGSVVNQGTLRASAGGYLALFGKQVDNQGEITVDAGQVLLASGSAATVSISGNGLISAVVTPGAAGSVLNSGSIQADGGVVRLTAASAEGIAASLVNNSGLVRANTITERGGEIWITGDHVASSGPLQADAPAGGNAGRIVVKGDLTDGRLDLDGRLSATAASGRGGEVETSAAQVAIAPSTRVDTRGAAGAYGHWTIDPTDFRVSAGNAAPGSTGIGAETLSTNLNSGNVSLLTAIGGSEPGDIHFDAEVNWTADTTLTVISNRDINFNASLTAGGANAGLVLTPGAGGFLFVNTTDSVKPKITLSGANATLSIGGATYTLVRDLAGLQAINNGLAGRYALAGDIDASTSASLGFVPIGNEVGGTNGAVAATGLFTGVLEGLGHTITDLTINRPTSNATGLFASTSAATLRNFELVGGTISGSRYVGAVAGYTRGATTLHNVRSSASVAAVDDSSSGVWAGGLVGLVEGSSAQAAVQRSQSSGSVAASTNTASAFAGGLVGEMDAGLLTGVSASGNVTATLSAGTNNTSHHAGGLVGLYNGGKINTASASGNVVGGHESGGLIGRFLPSGTATITQATASGSVSGTGDVGGLVGYASGSGSISNSGATGSVSTTVNENQSFHAGGAVGRYGMSAAPVALSAAGNVSGGNTTGGVIGWIDTSFNIALDANSLVSVVPVGTTKTVTGPRWVGGLIGYSDSTAAFSGLGVDAAVTATGSAGTVGGLIGRLNGALSNSSAAGSVTAVGEAGGLVGRAQGTGGLSNVSSSASVTSTGTSGAVGGLVGSYTNTGALTGGSASGAVQGGSGTGAITGGLVGSFNSAGGISGGSTAITSTVRGGGDTGGLVGQAAGTGGAAIVNSTARGAVTGGNNVGLVGGLVGDFSMAGGWNNVTVEGAVSGGNRTGGLAGQYSSAAGISSGSFLPTSISGGTYVGGLVGYITSTAIIGGASSNSLMSVGIDVTATAAGGSAGGLAGRSGGAVVNARSSGAVQGSGNVGGLVGEAGGSGGFSNVAASGNVTGTGTAGNTGGLVGSYANAGALADASASGAVQGGSGTSATAGGLVGNFNSVGGISNASTASTSTVAGGGNLGGLVGTANGTLTSAINGATVRGAVTGATNSGDVGGLAGSFSLNAGFSNVTVQGAVTGGNRTGGLVGFYNSPAAVTGGTYTPASVSGFAYVGGLIGFMQSTAAITGPSALNPLTVNINVSSTAATVAAGGVVGHSNGAITNVRSLGTVTGVQGDLGGLVGDATGTGGFSNVSATGNVSNSGNAGNVGGLVGQFTNSGGIATASASGNVSGGAETGGLVGNYSSAGNVSAATATGAVTSSGTGDTGGLIGIAAGTGRIENSSATGSVTSAANGNVAGGLVGEFSMAGGIVNSSAGSAASVGTPGSTVSGSTYAGGVVGWYNSGTALVTDTNAGTEIAFRGASVSGTTWAGGVVGYMQSVAALTGLRATADVTATANGSVAGGLVGRSAGAITNAAASGSVTSGGDAGGLVGRAEGSGGLTDVSASGNVSSSTAARVGGLVGYATSGGILRGAASGSVSGGQYTGGLVGWYQPSVNAAIQNATTTGSVSGSGDVGGIVGFATGAGSLGASSASGNVSSAAVNTFSVGGVAGYFALTGGMSGVTASGNVDGGAQTGGVVGYYDTAAALTNGALPATAVRSSAATVRGSNWVGGVVGYMNSAAPITGLVSGAAVTATGNGGAAGGVVGRTVGPVSSSSATGNVVSAGSAGGLIGRAEGTGALTDVSASGNVTSSSNACCFDFGGLAGSVTSGAIVRGSASGAVVGGNRTGGLVGFYSNAGGISDSSTALTSTVTGIGDVGGLVGQSSAGSYTDVTARGAVNGPVDAQRSGGLIGFMGAGDILRGTASGAVSGGNNSGGLVGGFFSSGSITASSASGAVTGGTYAGGLVGDARGSYSNVQASGNVSGTEYVGGLIGSLFTGGAVSTATATGNVTNTGNYAGGLIGIWQSSASIVDSRASGNVVAGTTFSGGDSVGGLVGYASNSATGIDNSQASGNVRGRVNVGGLVGQMQSVGLSRGTAAGAVTAVTDSSVNAGGLIGYYFNSGAKQITDSTASGNVFADARFGNVGGLIGEADSGTITGSHARGSVTFRDSSNGQSSSTIAGGLVGYFQGTSISTSTAIGNVEGLHTAGGLVGVYWGGSASASMSDVSATGSVRAANTVGGLAGQLNGVALSNGSASGAVTATTNSGDAGGLIGSTQVNFVNTTINASLASGNVSGGQRSGGLVGNMSASSFTTGNFGVSNSRASGQVTGSTIAGGLIGLYSGLSNATIDTGITNSHASGSVDAVQNGGGLVGQFSSAGGITDSSASGNVVGRSGTGTHSLGGLVGQFNNSNATAGLGTLRRSYASGNVTLDNTAVIGTFTDVNAGGLAGLANTNTAGREAVTDSWASGAVTVSNALGDLRAGGLVGNTNGGLNRSYAIGAVSLSGGNTANVGGLVGLRTTTAATATSSYWATDTTGQAASALGTAKTLAELRTAATFTGWDIASSGGTTQTWRIYEGLSTPLLRGLLTPATVALADLSKVYDGQASLAGTTVQAVGGPLANPERVLVGGIARDAGSYALTPTSLYSVQNGYDLTVTGSAQLTITPRALTLAGLVASKVYDGTLDATLVAGAQPGGLAQGDDLLFQPGNGFALQFIDKNAGVGKTVSLSGSYTWADGVRGKAANYTLPSATSTTADITPAPLTAGGFTATNRVYDGTTTVAVTATAATLSGLIGSDNVVVDLSGVNRGTMADKHVGTAKPVTVQGVTLGGTDAGNYALTGLDAVTVDITPRTATFNGITATNRQYSTGLSVSVNTGNVSLSGVLAGDQLQPSFTNGLTASVADKNVGTAKPVTVTGLRFRGADAGNYTPAQGPVTVDITPRLLTASIFRITGTDRVYDGTTNATVGVQTNQFGTQIGFFGDDLTLNNTGIAYDTKDVAYNASAQVTSKTITISGLSISGADASNYALQNTTATTTGTISPKPLPVTGVVALGRTYDGTRNVDVSLAGASVDTSVVVPGDNVGVDIPPGTGTVVGQMADKNAGTGKAVTVPGLVITGADAGNYTLNSAANGITVDIARKDLTAIYTGVDKVYDASTVAEVSITSNDIVSGDDVRFNASRNAGCFGCWTFFTTGSTNPNNFTQDKNVAVDKPIVITFNGLFGTDASNYRLLNSTGSTTATISPRPVTLTFSGVSKVYDGSTDANVALTRGGSSALFGDSLSTTQTAVYTDSKNVGNNKPISISNIVLSGTDAANYAVGNTTATTTGSVTPKPITLTGIVGVDRPYDGSTTVAVSAGAITSSGFVANDVVSVAQPVGGLTAGTIANRNVGNAKPVTVTGLSLTGSDASNYSIDLPGSGITVNIRPKALTPAYTGIDKVYNGDLNASVTPATPGIIAGDTVTFTQRAVFADSKNVGTAKPVNVSNIVLGGSGAANYTLDSTTATTTASITPKPATVDYTGVSRAYNGLADTSVSVLGSSLQLLAGDAVGFTQSASLVGDGAAGPARPVAVSGITLTGADAVNYSLSNTTASTTANITPRPLGVTGITATNRVYDGTTTVAVNVAGASVDTSGVVGGDTVIVTLPPSGISTGSMADRHVGIGKPVAITGLDLAGSSAANYQLIGASGLTVDIAPRPLTAVYTGVDKIYDGLTRAGIISSSADIFGIDAGGVIINAVGNFTGADARNVGSAKPVAVTGGFLTGAQRDNYTLLNTSGSTTAGITPRPLTVSYASGLSKVYDGSTAAPASGQLQNLVNNDPLSVTQTAVFAGSNARNVGNGKAIDISDIQLVGNTLGNYTLSTVSASTVGNITPKPITVGGLTNVVAVDRVYNGSTQVQVTVPAGVTLVPNSSDIVAGDQVSIEVPLSGVTTGSMADKHVGNAKPVSVDGLSLTGTEAGNYRIAGTAGITVSIAPKALTASYLGVDRTYDSTVAATVTGTSADILAGDSVIIRGSGVFTGAGAKNVGLDKPIEVQQASLSSSDARNYTLLNPTGSASADITPRPVTISYLGTSKVYDGTADAFVIGSGPFFAGDSVTLSQTAVFSAGRNVGLDKSIAISGIALSGSDAANYQLNNIAATASGDITPRPLGINGLTGVSAVDRVYDGTTRVDVNVLSTGTISVNTSDIVAGDAVDVIVPPTGLTTGETDNKHVGNAKPVRVTGLALTGTDAGNYTITAANGVTVNIAPRPLTALYSGVTKVYDGNTAAQVTGSSADIIGGDSISIAGSGVFSGSGGRNAGTAKAIDVLTASLAGLDAANYTLLNPLGSALGEITPKAVSASYSGGTRIYDGGVAAPVDGVLAGAIAGDLVALTQTAVFTGPGARNVGSGKAIAITGIGLSGADAGNYALDVSSASATGSITPRPLGVTGLTGVTAVDRVYDGSNLVDVIVGSIGTVSANPADIVAGDDVRVSAPGAGISAGSMADKHVGTAKPVVVAGLTLEGADAGNYTVGAASGVTVNIAPRPLTASYLGISRIYDGSIDASVIGTSADMIGGDALSILGSGVFTGIGARNAGTGKSIAVQTAALSGADAGNYRLVNPSGSASGDITPRPLSASYTGIDKVYDGTAAAQVALAPAAGLIAGDAVTVSQTALFAGVGARNAGTGKTVEITGISLSGSDAPNYSLVGTTASTTASITPKPLNVSGLAGLSAVDRVYDGTRDVQVSVGGGGAATSADIIPGDDVTIIQPGGAINAGIMLDKHAGQGKSVALVGLTLAGADAPNYQITGTLGLTVNIAKKPVTLLGLTAIDREYDGTTLVAIDSSGGSISGAKEFDDLRLQSSGVTGSMADKHVGTGKAVTVAGLSLAGADAANYSGGTDAALQVNITRRSLVAGMSVADKVYDGETGARITLTDNRVSGDSLTLSAASALFDTKNVGTGKAVNVTGLSLEGVDAANYQLASNGLTGSASITPAPLTVTASAQDKVYGESGNLGTTAFQASGLVKDETIGRVTLTSAGTAPAASVAGGPYGISVSDAREGSFDPVNYSLSYVPGLLTVTPRPVTVATNSVVRFDDEPNPLTWGFSTSQGGLLGSDSIASVRQDPPPLSANATGVSVFRLQPSEVVFGSGDRRNYNVIFGSGLLVVLPRPQRLDDPDEGGDNNSLAVTLDPALLARADDELDRAAQLHQLRRGLALALGPRDNADRPPQNPPTPAEIQVLLDGDSRNITLPLLQRLPLLSFDPALRRLIEGGASRSQP